MHNTMNLIKNKNNQFKIIIFFIKIENQNYIFLLILKKKIQ